MKLKAVLGYNLKPVWTNRLCPKSVTFKCVWMKSELSIKVNTRECTDEANNLQMQQLHHQET